MFVIVKTMHEDAITALETRNKSLADDVVNATWMWTGSTADRPADEYDHAECIPVEKDGNLHNYGYALLHAQPDHRKNWGSCGQDCREYPADYRWELDKKILAAVKKASSLSMENFDRSIISFFNADLKDANRNIESIHALEAICEDIDNLVLKQETLVAIHVGYIAESIRRAGEYAGDISETVINLLMENELTRKKNKGTK